MKKVLVSVSTEPAKENLIEYVKKIEMYADLLHCDVMDGEFVKNISLSPDTVRQINEISTLPLDVHLMVKNPEKVLRDYLESGANILTVHFEAFDNISQLEKTLKSIPHKNCLRGLSINPKTEVSQILPLLNLLDLVLIMSVTPGKSGQKFNSSILEKIRQLGEIKEKYNLNFLIEVDGGINNENSSKIISAGADILVSGSYVYSATDYQQAIKNLKK